MGNSEREQGTVSNPAFMGPTESLTPPKAKGPDWYKEHGHTALEFMGMPEPGFQREIVMYADGVPVVSDIAWDVPVSDSVKEAKRKSTETIDTAKLERRSTLELRATNEGEI
jgi:hypothetical protein